MTSSDYGVVLFYSTSVAIRAEKLTQEAGLKIKLIPVPRQLSSDCGVCVRFERPDEESVRQRLAEAKVEIQGVFPT